MKIKNTEVKVIKGDISALKVEAIVDPALGGKAKIGRSIATGKVKLPCRFVIHAVAGAFKPDEAKVRLSIRGALKVAEGLKAKSISLPALGCGAGGFPYLACAKIMAQEVFRHLRDGKSRLREIIFCLSEKEAFDTFNKGVISYLEHVKEVLQNGPFTTVDAIIEMDSGIVIIKRSNPPFGWALPGGFVDYGESLEQAVTREAKEETGLKLLGLRQFHTYSDPDRDPRFHTIGTVFIARAKGRPKAGDDAASLKIVSLKEVKSLNFAFDHKEIIQDYLKYRTRKSLI